MQNTAQPYAINAQEAEHMRSQHALLLRNSLKGTQDSPKVAHIGTSKAHEISQGACITPEGENLKSSTENLDLEKTTSLPQVAIAHQSQTCIKAHKTNDNEVQEKATSTTPTTHVVGSTSLQSQYVPMKPLSEYRVEGSFQLRSATTSSIPCLYEDIQGGQFQLLFSPQERRMTNKGSSSIYM